MKDADGGGAFVQTSFTVLGEPQGKGRPRFMNHKGRVAVWTPAGTALYENLVRVEYVRQSKVRFPDDAQLEVTIDAYYKIPASTTKKRREDMLNGVIRPAKKPDIDNILKVVSDGLNEVAYRDDVQIVGATVRKWYAENPRLEVMLCAGGSQVADFIMGEAKQ